MSPNMSFPDVVGVSEVTVVVNIKTPPSWTPRSRFISQAFYMTTAMAAIKERATLISRVVRMAPKNDPFSYESG